jgi:hypothetical protein
MGLMFRNLGIGWYRLWGALLIVLALGTLVSENMHAVAALGTRVFGFGAGGSLLLILRAAAMAGLAIFGVQSFRGKPPRFILLLPVVMFISQTGPTSRNLTRPPGEVLANVAIMTGLTILAAWFFLLMERQQPRADGA